ncbi:DUF1176 domain-containing protein [Cognatilysobacter terrigena]|uniref:DUF1176 domain-containing protein n=1 Tax=Cognatilysobacter terrigena TaxID=2488749 RepID=UPI00105B7D30|nr:DUF1176 domain-containing protein [Lysobacter terrigena]
MSSESFRGAARAAALVLSALLASSAHAAVALPAYRTFGDWTVACDNTGACEARGYTDNGDDSLALRVVRAAGRDAVPTFEVVDIPDGAGATLKLDGRALSFGANALQTRASKDDDNAPTRTLVLRGVAALQSLAAQARRAKHLGLAGTASVGSLTGFNAAMLFIDDAQGRVDTPTAIARPGRSNAAIPDARPLPAVHAVPSRGKPLSDAAVRRYVDALKKLHDDCDDDVGSMTASVDPIGDAQVIALVPCVLGAYQGSYAAFISPRNDPAHAKPLRLPFPPGIDDDSSMLTEAGFDAKTGRLSTFAKGRGLADCGMSAEWAWDGRAFVLASYTLLDRCGWPEPGDLLTVWRTADGAPR